MLLNKIKTLLCVTDNDELIHEITELTKSKILNYINETELPNELEFVLIELAIQRYNRIGSEGIASESVDGKSVSYEADFESYKHYLDDYISKNSINEIYLCGFDTDGCILKTAFDLFENNIKTYILQEYCMSSGGEKYHYEAIDILKRSIGEKFII